MNEINTINELILELDSSSKKDRKAIVDRLNLNKKEFEAFSTWEEHTYTRNCLARSEEYEIILLCWDKQSATPIHGHGGQDCWVYQVDGEVEEMRFRFEDKSLKLSKNMRLGAGDISYMTDDMGYHLIKNPNDQRAMTLHIYAAPIDECEVFDPANNVFKITQMQYDYSFSEEVVKV